jgi:hypothetical protein
MRYFLQTQTGGQVAHLTTLATTAAKAKARSKLLTQAASERTANKTPLTSGVSNVKVGDTLLANVIPDSRRERVLKPNPAEKTRVDIRDVQTQKEVPSFTIRTKRHRRNDEIGKRVRGQSAGISLHLNHKNNAVPKHTVPLQLEQGTPAISIKMEGKARRMILDSGSSISILREGVSKSKVKDSPLKPYGVTGEALRIFGQQTVAFALGGHTYDHTFVISELPTEATGILGMDFLEKTGAKINFQTGSSTLSVCDENAHSYGRLPTKCAVFTGFLKGKTVPSPPPKRRKESNWDKRSHGTPVRNRCFKCQERGHLARECPSKF